jgi:putative DNA primase/helicase
MADALGVARRLLAEGFAPIAVPYGTKNPGRKGWQDERLTADDLAAHFNGQDQNIGVLTGEPSGGLVDTDLDCAEAVSVAPRLLPPTDRIGGRGARPRSHQWHKVDRPPPRAATKYLDPIRMAHRQRDTATIVELRSTGAQTIVHGQHPDGDTYRWDAEGVPASVAISDLTRAVTFVATASLIARYWPPAGARHDAALAWSGSLRSGGLSGADVVRIIEAAVHAAGDEEADDRVTAARTTAARFDRGEPVTGGPTLITLLGDDARLLLSAIAQWLEFRRYGGQQDGDAGVDSRQQRRSRERAAAKKDRPQENGYKRTDLGNAERLIARHGRDLLYVPTWGWTVYDGQRWRRDEGEISVTRRAAETVRAIYDEAAAAENTEDRAALAKHAAASERSSRISAMVTLARADARVEASVDLFDADPLVLNCPNGVLDLRTGTLREHRREDYLTRLAGAAFDPNAAAPQWGAFLDRIFDGDDAVIRYLQRAAGYALTGDTSERALFLLWGSGANGKSTALDTLKATLGDYALRTPTETLLAKRDGGIPNDVARLRGARLVTASETEDGRRLAEAFIKDLTGGDTLSARFLHGEWFDFRPTGKIWLATNHKPAIRGTDNAIWDRIRLIPFTVTIPQEERDRQLLAKLSAERSGILAWMVRGCLDWQRNGLREPVAVRDATEAYRQEQDVLGMFLAERCVIDPRVEAAAAQLYQTYVAWSEAAGERPLPQRGFGMRLTERGFTRRKRVGNIWWTGIDLRSSAPPPSGSGTIGMIGDQDPGSLVSNTLVEKNPESGPQSSLSSLAGSPGSLDRGARRSGAAGPTTSSSSGAWAITADPTAPHESGVHSIEDGSRPRTDADDVRYRARRAWIDEMVARGRQTGARNA